MINFVKYRYITIFFGLISCIYSVVEFNRQGLNYGIDFSGGVVAHVKESKENLMKNHKNVTEMKKNLCVIKCANKDELKISENKIEYMKEIGGKSQNAMSTLINSIIFSLIAMMLYVWMKFRLSMSIIATISLIHDILIILGYYVITQNEINETSIIAFLSTIAYSINDTVVIWDRIRETSFTQKKNIINISLNSTLRRTMYTSLTTAASLIALSLLGGETIQELSHPMLIGLIAGTYSSILIAGPMFSFVI